MNLLEYTFSANASARSLWRNSIASREAEFHALALACGNRSTARFFFQTKPSTPCKMHLAATSHPSVVAQECRITLIALYQHSPLLGFALVRQISAMHSRCLVRFFGWLVTFWSPVSIERSAKDQTPFVFGMVVFPADLSAHFRPATLHFHWFTCSGVIKSAVAAAGWPRAGALRFGHTTSLRSRLPPKLRTK